MAAVHIFTLLIVKTDSEAFWSEDKENSSTESENGHIVIGDGSTVNEDSNSVSEIDLGANEDGESGNEVGSSASEIGPDANEDGESGNEVGSSASENVAAVNEENGEVGNENKNKSRRVFDLPNFQKS